MFIASGQIQFAPALAALHRQCFDSAWSEDEIKALLALPTTVGWMTEQGFLLCSCVVDEIEILTIGVLPEARRQHIASRLLQEMFDWAQQHNQQRIFLEVSVENQAARALYTRCGFKQTGRRTGYYKTPQGSIDALCLTRYV